MTRFASISILIGLLLAGCQGDAGETSRPAIDQEDAKALDEAAAKLDAEATAPVPN